MTKARDPVCGMRVEVGRPGAFGVYGTETVYFCRESCKTIYEARERYLTSLLKVHYASHENTDRPGHDPVCGMDVDVERATVKGVYDSGTVYFCSERCKAIYEARRDYLESLQEMHSV